VLLVVVVFVVGRFFDVIDVWDDNGRFAVQVFDEVPVARQNLALKNHLIF
jgi:hypothetical protein